MQTPTTTTREKQRRAGDYAVEDPGDADALEDHRPLRLRAELFGDPPDVMPGHRQRVCSLLHRADRELGGRPESVSRWPRPAAASNGEPSAGSTTTSAPQARASSRRPAEKSLATIVADARGLQHHDDGQADRPTADHDRDLVLLDLRPSHCVVADRQRLGEDAELRREAVRQRERQRLLDHDLLGVGARCRGREADRVHLVSRAGAAAAPRPPNPARASAGSGPVAEHLAAELVAEDDPLIGAHEAVVAGLAREASACSSAWWRAWRSEPQIPQRTDLDQDLPLGPARVAAGRRPRAWSSRRRPPSCPSRSRGDQAVVERRQRLDQGSSSSAAARWSGRPRDRA